MNDAKLERCYLRRVVGWVLLAALIVGMLVLYSGMANADPIARAVAGTVTVTLHDTPCTLDAVENLKQRVTWEEEGKVTEGCWGRHPQFPVLLFYFADRAVTILPMQAFTPVTSG